MENENKAIVFDYKTVRVKRSMEAMVTDAYEAMGWQVTNTTMAEGNLNSVNVSFKRDRKIENKMELVKLQDKIDTTLTNIEKLSRQRKNVGIAEGLTTGVVGALVFGSGMSMSLVLSGTGFLIGGIALGLVGVGIMAVSYLVYSKSKKKKLSSVEPTYQSELDKLSDLCEEANKLLNTNAD